MRLTPSNGKDQLFEQNLHFTLFMIPTKVFGVIKKYSNISQFIFCEKKLRQIMSQSHAISTKWETVKQKFIQSL